MPPDIHSSDIATLIASTAQTEIALRLSRLLTLAAAGRCVRGDWRPHSRTCRNAAAPVIALTGSGGVGKSSLLGALAAHFAERGERVGVLACDPESPVTGGALLGDRCRIAGDDDIGARSSSAACPPPPGNRASRKTST